MPGMLVEILVMFLLPSASKSRTLGGAFQEELSAVS